MTAIFKLQSSNEERLVPDFEDDEIRSSLSRVNSEADDNFLKSMNRRPRGRLLPNIPGTSVEDRGTFDLYSNGLYLFFSDRALQEALKLRVQVACFIPIEIIGAAANALYCFRFGEVFDCITEQSEFVINFTVDGITVCAVLLHAQFRSGTQLGSDMFWIKSPYRDDHIGEAFVSQRFVDMWTQAGLTGAEFVKVGVLE